ncbi:hypothetical protein LLEC1_07772 [Akanthomyces lecanii]|uniref:Domain of unknown function at the cortex 1 domain-containing protein n=1 Tax=Cordyceps confragosa TaxID=2714763 RepID=A0A179I1N5_CORDF|nr:hypothetical protein LLEC1_07772 [Akanthomyces lecanii]
MADKYILRITAGGDYDEAKHVQVPVNEPETIKIATPHADIELNVRIQGYQGLPPGSPSTSAYFSAEPHAANQDQYSISFRFTPKAPTAAAAASSSPEKTGISGAHLQFGNDFDRPIRDKLPPGFNTAMRIVKWWIDPGLDGDAYADKPHLYGPALSSFNARMKWALSDANKDRFVFEYGKTYGLDFFNPYLDFANLALRLPGFQLSIANYWDGQALRYVLRNKETGDVYLVVVFSLFLREDLNEDGTLREGAQQHTAGGSLATQVSTDRKKPDTDNEHDHDEEAALKRARDEFGVPHHETSADDVD